MGNKSKVNMPDNLKNKCHAAIHTATVAAAAAGAIPIPVADAIPITAAQITMVVALGKVFDVTLTESAAKCLLGAGVTNKAGHFVASNLIKAIPGPARIVGSIVGGSTAAAFTEALGWVIADDFYRMSIGEEPTNIVGAVDNIQDAFDRARH